MFQIPHQPIYALLSIAHFGSCFGLDHLFVLTLLATGYAALALSR